MPTPTYTITCTYIEKIAHDVYEMRFTKPDTFSFKPGQFVLFDVPDVDNEADMQPRAYSVASTPSEDELLFVIKLTENGRMSKFIVQKLVVGTELIMKGPFGVFTLNRQTPKDYLFLATSTGIAPFRSQVLAALEEGDQRRMDIVFCVREEADLFWVQELEDLAEKNPNVWLHVTLSQPHDTWEGCKGRLQQVTPQLIDNLAGYSVYACGNPDMTKDIKRLCLEEWGLQKTDVHIEGYI